MEQRDFGAIFQKVTTLKDVIKENKDQVDIQTSPKNREKLRNTEVDLKRLLKIEEEL